jgi:hypothetical protein
MANKKTENVTEIAMHLQSLVVKDCARFTAEHDRITATYRSVAARLDQAIFKRSGRN